MRSRKRGKLPAAFHRRCARSGTVGVRRLRKRCLATFLPFGVSDGTLANRSHVRHAVGLVSRPSEA